MIINLLDIGKRYRLEWIFRGVTADFGPGSRHAVVGPNGSGKSTLMKVLSGHLTPTRGEIQFFEAEKKAVAPEKIWQKVAYAAPYIELIEELTLAEAIDFHGAMKPFFSTVDREKILQLLDFQRVASKKELRFFSSGQKQRVKLALAACSATPVLLLDEPTTNLDEQGVRWYQKLVEDFSGPARTVVIASNDPVDLEFCQTRLAILDFKAKR